MPEPKPLFTEAQVREDGQNRVARTVGQVTVPGAIITVGDFVMQRYLHQEPLPPSVVMALGVIGTGLAAWLTNLRRLRGEGGITTLGVVFLVLLVLLLLGYLGRP